MSNTEHLPGVLIVGGGYAGMHAARAAAAAGAPVTIVDPVGVHGFTTRLAAVAGGTAPIGDAFAPLDAFDHRYR
ncbi:MAG: FAD-dependent oxidoreductase, partial [Acidimicrobiia bacterium]|nr:FAD-dependent oxidoreductase [Acidimicrobiia bacterium]